MFDGIYARGYYEKNTYRFSFYSADVFVRVGGAAAAGSTKQ